MKNKKQCCRIFPIVLILISTIFALAIWYFDEGVRQFTFLNNWGEFVNFIGIVLFISIIPIGIFYFLVEKKKYEPKAKLLALLGFLPPLILLIFILF
jgi:purine-cytosine permease-like protein